MKSRLRSLKSSTRRRYRRTLSGSGKPDFPQQYRARGRFGLKLQRLSAEEISRRTQAALRLCQLTDVAEAHPLDLHAAQRRMVAVASLEAMAPPVLLLDEPSRDFDAHWLTVFEHWLATCRARGTSVVAISHDAAFTRRHFSRVVQLENGRLSGEKTGRRSDPFYAVLRITAALSLWRSRCPP